MLVDREVIECFISWGELKVLEALNQDELAPLMERVTHGDQKALSDLYDATRSRVFSLALFMVRETDLAEDVVVDVYAQIWRNAASYDESKGGVLNWVLMMSLMWLAGSERVFIVLADTRKHCPTPRKRCS